MHIIYSYLCLVSYWLLFNLDRFCVGEKVSCFQRYSRAVGGKIFHLVPYNVTALNLRMGYKRLTQGQTSARKHPISSAIWKAYSVPISLEESSSLHSENYPSENDFATEDSSEELLAQPLSNDEVSFVISFCFLWNILFSIKKKG